MLQTPVLTEEKTPNNVSQDTWQAGRDAALLLAPSTARWIISSSLGATTSVFELFGLLNIRV
jgi:hypothetical protein